MKDYGFLENTIGKLKAYTEHLYQQKFLLATVRNEEALCSYWLKENYWFQLECETTIADLFEFERLRNGNEPKFDFDLKFHITWAREIVKNEGFTFDWKLNVDVHIPFVIPQKTWINFLNKLGLFEYHLFELNNPIQDSPEMVRISSAVKESIDFFYQGGPMGWKNSVSKIRDAMNLLDKLYPLPSRDKDKKQDKDLTRNERWIESYRSLKNLAHLSQHPEDDPDEWSRDEAQVVLTSFLGVWSLRKFLVKKDTPE
ncbi:hypothetical protein [Leptospira sp. 'Mane']|uniref:hypothetical protein n=1 Tax=Leptospira sp. 'Mane' TaxID=3387407 RepID=UPI00398B0DFE